ncbi:MAG: hypothetical protein GY809_13100 [Planctomycetes bacterium]|nr:hypothetical protein [Planctomycetota bacterium]
MNKNELAFWILILLLSGMCHGADWKPAQGPLTTPWTDDVSPDHVWSEYPRPQMVRPHWTNLNGLWDYAIVAKAADQPDQWDGEILVPFAVESALSGVKKTVLPEQRPWYRRTFDTPRKTAVSPDADGVLRLKLNNEVLFPYGPLDQGWWPDGLYTPPSDDAIKYDIAMTKKLGMNMARKHVKYECARWYYWCDRMGLLVWQDMPAGDSGRNDESKANYYTELKAMTYTDEPPLWFHDIFRGDGTAYRPEEVKLIRSLTGQ